jgi:hypothetical protein
LYKAIEEAFSKVYPTGGNFLSFFCRDCYLEDLFKKIAKTVEARSHRDREVEDAEVRLSELIKEKKPEIIISVVKRIAVYVDNAKKYSDINAEFHTLCFPTWGWKQDFIKELEGILRGSTRYLKTRF